MKNILFILLLFAASANAQISIPDPVLKSKILSSTTENNIAKDNVGNSIQVDADSNGEISVAEAMAVYELDISNPTYEPVGPFVSDMTGIDAFANLRNLNCTSNQIATLDLTFLSSLRILNCSYNQLTALDLSNLIQLENLNCSFNAIEALDVSMLSTITELNCTLNEISSLDVSSLVNLQVLHVGGNALTSLDISALPILENLDCSANYIQSIDFSGNPNLIAVSMRDNLLQSVDFTPVPNLLDLDVSGNLLTAIDLSNLPLLRNLSFRANQISGIAYTWMLDLFLLIIGDNPLGSLDLSPMPNLVFLDCQNSQISALDLSVVPELAGLVCSDNQLTTLDASDNYNLHNIDCRNNQLSTLFLKNGAISTGSSNFDFSENAGLEYICADDAEQDFIQSKIVEYGYADCLVNTYCSFVPGGESNTITGSVSFDADNNGCDSSDPKQPHLKLAISDGTTTGATFTTLNGNYNFYTQTGNFTVTPQVENPSYFTFAPASASSQFANNNNNVATHNFCVSANGVHPDVEVVVAPIGSARPGFDAHYKIVYKNKGNQVLSGVLTFGYDDSILDLVEVSVSPDSQNPGELQWNYTDLLPFEVRVIFLTLNVNGPMETPAVNMDDVLEYSVAVSSATGDDLPADNAFTLNQIVVNAFDPNSVTCLEGDVVDPSSIGQYLHYVVDFENLGTAAAENVVVRIDVDPALYDINSLQMMDTSHPSYTRVTGNVVEFVFEGIELAPAAGDPPVGGHGNVLFKIRSNNALETGDSVQKLANIFFDYNFPIETNEAETIFQSLSNPSFAQDNSISVFPNPTSGTINISSDAEVVSMELFDVQGRLLEVVYGNSVMDISSRSTGLYFLRIKTGNGIKVEKLIKN